MWNKNHPEDKVEHDRFKSIRVCEARNGSQVMPYEYAPLRLHWLTLSGIAWIVLKMDIFDCWMMKNKLKDLTRRLESMPECTGHYVEKRWFSRQHIWYFISKESAQEAIGTMSAFDANLTFVLRPYHCRKVVMKY
jgi:hypothetical protein